MTEVLILGGGPAGAGAAAFLARLGQRVTLVSRATRHALGESVPPSSRKVLAELGLLQVLDGAGFYQSRGNTVWWGGAAGRVEPFPANLPGWQVERPALDRVLVEAARAAGATVLPNVSVREVTLRTGEAVVACEAPDGPRELRAPWVLDCTGRAGILARQVGRRAPPDQDTLAIHAVWERPRWDLPDETHTLVESYADGWAWSVPVSSSRRYVAVMVDADAVRRAPAGLAVVYDRELAKARQVSGLVSGAALRRPPRGEPAAPYQTASVGEPGWLLVGDAASFVDPLSSFGVKKALASAWLASVVVHTALAEPALAAQAVDLFGARERDAYALLSRQAADLCAEAAAAHRHRFWSARAVAEPARPAEPDIDALRADPQVLAAFEALRRAPSVRLRQGPGVGLVPRPVVRGTRVVLDEHLVWHGMAAELRYLRGVNLPRLVSLAPQCTQVGELYQRYSATESEVPLPDFLGVLSVLVARRALVGEPAI